MPPRPHFDRDIPLADTLPRALSPPDTPLQTPFVSPSTYTVPLFRPFGMLPHPAKLCRRQHRADPFERLLQLLCTKAAKSILHIRFHRFLATLYANTVFAKIIRPTHRTQPMCTHGYASLSIRVFIIPAARLSILKMLAAHSACHVYQLLPNCSSAKERLFFCGVKAFPFGDPPSYSYVWSATRISAFAEAKQVSKGVF